MRTEIKKVGDTVIVNMLGTLDFETAIPLREELNRLLLRVTPRATTAKTVAPGHSGKKSPTAYTSHKSDSTAAIARPAAAIGLLPTTQPTTAAPPAPRAPQIIFNLENLEFVGSSGISSFVQALKEFNLQAPSRPIYCNVKSEFKRIIKAFDEEAIFDIEEGRRIFN
jgi:anti-anti-sigma regulatory factor